MRGDFPCHKTTVEDEDGDLVANKDSKHCALIFMEKIGETTQMMRIAERLGMYDMNKLMSDKRAVALVFDSREMIAANKLK